jgi:hypothetical protein
MNKHQYPILERNNLLFDFFKYLGFQNVKLLGDENQPKIILDDMKAVSGFVKNKYYNFTDKPFGGNVVYTINLQEKEHENIDYVRTIIHQAERRIIYRLLVDNSSFFFCKIENNIPYFSNIDARYYFEKAKADRMKDYLQKEHNIQSIII